MAYQKIATRKRRTITAGFVAVLALSALAGCMGDAADTPANTTPAAGAQDTGTSTPATASEIVIGSPAGWTGEEIRSHMVTKVMRDELGYDVKLIEQLQAGVIYTSLAEGDINVFVGAWLPLQQDSFDAQPEGSITILGDNLPSDAVSLSFAVPKYVADAGVTSLADLDAHKEKFGGKIMGIEPGAGMMQVAKARTALDVYGLSDWQIIDASTPAMLAAYDDAVYSGEWIAIMMWSPHFAYAKWQGDQAVTDLADPGWEVDGETMYLYKDQAEAARIQTLVNTGFEGTHPEAAAFLKNFQISGETENALMLQVNDGKSVKDVAYDYLNANPDLVASWLGK